MIGLTTSSLLRQICIDRSWAGPNGRLTLLAIAWLVLLWPTTQRLAGGLWSHPDHAYAPWLSAVALLLFILRLRVVRWQADLAPRVWAWILLLVAGAAYILGRSQHLEQLELLACVGLVTAAIGLAGGRSALRSMRFPLLFWAFTLPYPAWLTDQMTAPLRLVLSAGAEELLYLWGYPVARSGVIILLGPYRLLVEDACSGLNSLIFLAALGLLYIYLTGPRHGWHRWLLVASLLPLALLANFVRILLLLLTTYHLGDAVAQGLWHDLAGLMLFVTGFAALYGLDSILTHLDRRAPEFRSTRPDTQQGSFMAMASALSMKRTMGIAALWLVFGVGAALLAPRHRLAEVDPMPKLEQLVPRQLGDWRHDAEADSRYIPVEMTANNDGPYQQTLARTYTNGQGQSVMLVIAYGSQQLGATVQAHRPEACYKAEGFVLLQAQDASIRVGEQVLPVRQMLAQKHSRHEAVTYWMTIAGEPTLAGLPRKLVQLRHGLQGNVPDGALVRISSLRLEEVAAFELHKSFVQALRQAVPDRLGFQAGMKTGTAPGM